MAQSGTVEVPPVGGRVCWERLIALVQDRPPLYDYSHPAHCNRDVTGYMWSQIAAELGTTEIICKTKWANLRSNFVREFRRIRPSSDGTLWAPQWPLFKPLMFLLPFLKKRGSAGSFEEPTIITLEDFQESKKQIDNVSTEHVPKKIRIDSSIPAEEENNDDKLFMLSLVPKMRHLPMVENIKFRIEVQQLLLNRLCQFSEQSDPAETVQVMLDEDNDESDFQELSVKAE
ncbi:uncharacterized protein LOC124366547 isoform X1 [Homalodisca vitripennis]|uniref:uncharacterized protein LOC124366547 isoform X1 n=1 Tax=Homalodisca vitripennis TaxID=197043 RepID=UPI001EEB49AC|nr:uncharacterized protein LOC124366547 isoform X1 [Homalodisca vitripennis]